VTTPNSTTADACRCGGRACPQPCRAGQVHVGLVQQAGRAERHVACLAAQLALGEAMELRVGRDEVPVDPPAVAAATAVEGTSFAVGTQGVATVLMLALMLLAWRNADHPLVRALSTQVTVFVLIAAAVVVAGYWTVLYSRTAIDDGEIRQSGLLPRRVALADIGQLKLIRVRGLEWLVTPRLVVRARGSGMSTFYCADARVLAAAEQLAYGSAAPQRR